MALIDNNTIMTVVIPKRSEKDWGKGYKKVKVTVNKLYPANAEIVLSECAGNFTTVPVGADPELCIWRGTEQAKDFSLAWYDPRTNFIETTQDTTTENNGTTTTTGGITTGSTQTNSKSLTDATTYNGFVQPNISSWKLGF